MAGVPAVVAMQFPISDQAAIAFTDCLYPRLAQGLPLDTAVGEARKAIRIADRSSLEWATPVLFMRTPDGKLFDFADAHAEQVPMQTTSEAIAANSAAATAHASTSDAREEPARPHRKIAYALAAGTLLAIASAAVLIGYFRPAPASVTAPTPAEHSRFLAAADAATVSAADIDAVEHRSLKAALEMKALAEEERREELDARLTELSGSTSDPRSGAAVTLYLAAQIDALRNYFEQRGLSEDNFLPALRAASESGDALATYWLAVRMRGELLARQDDGAIDSTDAQFTEYCDTLTQAADQGMNEVAEAQASADMCL